MTDQNEKISTQSPARPNKLVLVEVISDETRNEKNERLKTQTPQSVPKTQTRPRVFASAGSFKFRPPQQDLYKSFRRCLGALLHNCRITHNLGLDEVSKDLKITPLMLDNIEIGKKNLFWFEIDKLLEYYNLTLVLRLEENRQPNETSHK